MKPTRYVSSGIAAFSVFLFLAIYSLAAPSQQKHKYLMYVGTYTAEAGSTSKGIYAYGFDRDTGELTPLGLAAETTNPSFLAVHPNHRFLYAVNETGNYNGQKSGAVSAFAIDRATGKLTFLNQMASKGADPCYIVVDKTGKFVLVANYTGGSVAVFPVLEDGRLGEASSFIQHTGHGSDPERQEGPHAHSIDLSPDNRFAIVDDLGLDETLVYRFDSAKGSLSLNDPQVYTTLAKADPGAGPRHFAFHPNGKFAYVVNEMGSTVSVFSYDSSGGVLRRLQTISAIPQDFSGHKEAAEIQVHPSGKFLYASNRGHNSIVGYRIDPSTGSLSVIGFATQGISFPRNFAIDPNGKWLYVANQKSDTIVQFEINPETGELKPTGQVTPSITPVAIVFRTTG